MRSLHKTTAPTHPPAPKEGWCLVHVKRLFLVLGAMFALVLSLPANGQAFHTQSAMNTGESWFNNNPVFNNTVWVRTDKGGVDRYASGIAIDPWNVLVTGHQLFQNSDGGHTNTVTIGTGNNYLSEPGLTFSASSWLYHPGWDGSVFSQRVDLGIVHIPQGIPGMQTLTIGTAVLGEQLLAGGFGRHAYGGNWQDLDGQGRSFKMWVDDFGLNTTISDDYIRSTFYPTFIRNDSMAGGATPGSSGSGVFNLNGDLVGLAVGGAGGGMPGVGYSTYSLRLDLYQDWIYANSIPTPSSLVLLAVGGIAAMRRRR